MVRIIFLSPRLWLANDSRNLYIRYFPSSVSSFEVLTGALANRVVLEIDNAELLQYAVLTGQNVTAEVLETTQLVVAQHGVYLTLDCGSLFRDTVPPGSSPTLVTWTRQLGRQGLFINFLLYS